MARILSECGFDVEIEKVVRTVRGSAEIDVYATETIQGRTYRLFCECKLWKSRIPQTVVHSFRTVVSDAGAHAGYIISSAGYQAGAFEAADLTNLKLVTWPEFQTEFEAKWIHSFLLPKLAEHLDPLFTYTEPINSSVFRKYDALDDGQRAYFDVLRSRYQAFAQMVLVFTPHFQMLGLELPTLPLKPPDSNSNSAFPEAFFEITAYRDLFDVATEFGEHAIREFRAALER